MTDVSFGPAPVNLTGIVQNDSWSVAVGLKADGAPYDLTGLECVASMKVGSANVPIVVTITDADAGQFTLSQTEAPLIGVGGRWALRVGTRTMLAGTVTGKPDVLPSV